MTSETIGSNKDMREIYEEIIGVISRGEQAVLATVISVEGSAPRGGGAKMLIKYDGTSLGSVGGGDLEQQVRKKAIEVMNTGQQDILHFDLSGKSPDTTMICGGQTDVLLEPILPLETLYIFGAGHISKSAAPIAKTLGFRVVIVDPRPDYNNRENFPDADMLVVEEFERAFTKLHVTPNDYIVICTTGHMNDAECLHFAVGTRAKYIGMIGSKKKVKETKDKLMQQGVTEERLGQVYAPIGLEIEAETPEEISISILSQIILVKRSS
jgi:xanthine dehydrogenase accessory factor